MVSEWVSNNMTIILFALRIWMFVTLQFFDSLNTTECLTIQFYSYTLPGINIRPHRSKGSVPKTVPTPDASCKYQIPGCPRFCLPWLQILGFLQAPSSGSTTPSLGQLTELRGALHSLLPVYYKGYSWGRARCTEQDIREGAWRFLPFLGVPHSQHLDVLVHQPGHSLNPIV